MFFQSKRKSLWKRLWRSRITPTQQQQHRNSPATQNHHHTTSPNCMDDSTIASIIYSRQTTINGGDVSSEIEGNGGGGTFGNCCSNRNSSTTYHDIDYQLFRGLVDKLKDRQLETLCQAVEMGIENCAGANCSAIQQTDCVLVPRGSIMNVEPHVIACRIWKWPDLIYAEELKRIPSCPNERDPVYTCCNPTHWSRRMNHSDTPPSEAAPPPYYSFVMDRLNPEGLSQYDDNMNGLRQFPSSNTTDGEEMPSGWCQLAYWELTQRVGRLFPVENSAVNIFSEQPRGDGLCLTTLAQQRKSTPPDAVVKARQKIGLGVTLSREADGVWLYNRSSAPVFVHSPTLHDLDTRPFLVYRVPPGHCLRAFDPNKASKKIPIRSTLIAGAQTGPIDTYSVRISFAKGWGPKYARQEVTACPCWLEVLLSPCR